MKCQYCGKEIPDIRYDTFGRRVTRPTKYCSKQCRNRAIYEANYDRLKEYRKQYYKDHLEKFKEYRTEYYKKHPEKFNKQHKNKKPYEMEASNG